MTKTVIAHIISSYATLLWLCCYLCHGFQSFSFKRVLQRTKHERLALVNTCQKHPSQCFLAKLDKS